MKISYFCTRGASDPTGASVPLHLAVNGSAAIGQEVEIILGGDAADLLTGDHLETLEGLGLPPMRELVAKMKEHQIPVYV